jgi:hypothetical protein
MAKNTYTYKHSQRGTQTYSHTHFTYAGQLPGKVRRTLMLDSTMKVRGKCKKCKKVQQKDSTMKVRGSCKKCKKVQQDDSTMNVKGVCVK